MTTDTAAVRRQYDTIIADHYDDDPQGVTVASLQCGLGQIVGEDLLGFALPPMRALDLGMGTGLFLEMLAAAAERDVRLFGVDLSSGMVERAARRLPGLRAEVADAADVADHFPGESFELICTHFVTGFVPLAHLAPRIFERLEPGGYWTFIGGTSAGYPELRRRARHPLVRAITGGKTPDLAGLLTPAGVSAVEAELIQQGLEIVAAETFSPELLFGRFEAFMKFAYHGGWLTPFLEDLGLERLGPFPRWLLNTAVFPIDDHHHIAVVLARKPTE